VPEANYRYPLDHDAEIVVRFSTERGELIRYRVMLLAVQGGEEHTVRLYDNTHGANEMHRYEGRDKQPAETFSHASAGEAMNEAIQHIFNGYREIIDSWAQ
jgi:hypothetical protein